MKTAIRPVEHHPNANMSRGGSQATVMILATEKDTRINAGEQKMMMLMQGMHVVIQNERRM
jgi:hypothetical protein